MKCCKFKAAINNLPDGCDTSRFFYQKVPGRGSFNPCVGVRQPNSLPEFNMLTAIQGWDEEDYVAVRNLPGGIELYSSPDESHKDDVLKVFPGNVAAIIGTV